MKSCQNDSLYVKHFHCIPPSYGGVQVYVKRLMLALCKRGLLSGAFYGKKMEGVPSEYLCLLDAFPRHARSLFVLPELYKLFRSFWSYKIIHSHSTLSTCFAVWLLHKTLKKPVVYTIHNQMIEQEFSFLNCIDKYCVRSLASDKTVQFITVNQNGKRQLTEKGIKFANDIKVIPAYIPPIEVGKPEDYIPYSLTEFLKNHETIILFYTESFASHNGKDIYGTKVIVDLFLNLKKIKPSVSMVFCLSNFNSQEKLDELKTIIESKGFMEDVFWQIGPLHEMWPIFKKSTILIRPTTTDGDSIMIREALSYGLPVITSNVTARPEGCIIYNTDIHGDLYDKTVEFLHSPYRKSFPQIDYTNQMLSIYESILQK